MNIKRLIIGPIETNCYIISTAGSNSCIIIDPGDDFEQIDRYLTSEKLIPDYIINTHGHYDHIMANNKLLDKYKNAILMVHKEDLTMLLNPKKNFSSITGRSFTSLEPKKLLHDNDTFTWKKFKFKIIHTPGHTKGGICILVGQYLFSGDTLFRNSVGRTDLPGGSFEAIITNIKQKLLTLDENTIVFPGHGEKTTIKNCREQACLFPT